MSEKIHHCYIEELRHAQEEARYREHIIDSDLNYPMLSDQKICREETAIKDHLELDFYEV
ncbi:MAG: hypothetical protein ACTSQI_22440 [Candidatus Helarchaeota archaeon]